MIPPIEAIGLGLAIVALAALARAWHLSSVARFGPDVVSESIRRDAARGLNDVSRLLR